MYRLINEFVRENENLLSFANNKNNISTTTTTTTIFFVVFVVA
jgi:hypothetical protein